MIGWAKLAWHYVVFHRWKTVLLVSCIFLTFYLPLLLTILLDQFQRQLVARADETPLVIGAPGSGLELTLHTLHFSQLPERSLPYREYRGVANSGLARAIPLFSRFRARGYPIVGTTLEYFPMRSLSLESGRPLTALGECVVGAEVARRLDLKPGDRLLSDRENLLDIAGLYPLKMTVVGVLAPNQTHDDRAVFVDLKTAWVIQGLGHGHDDVISGVDETKILRRDEGNVVASAAVLPYTEITPENIGSFHFHGDPDEFPLTAVIAIPNDEKSETILLGRYPATRAEAQMVIPRQVIEELMSLVFRVKRFFDANMYLVGTATLLLLILVLMLSQRLRAGEMRTMFKLGCSRGTISKLQLGELALVFVGAGSLLAIALWISLWMAPSLVERLIQ
ncbi:MAG TPA: ABC transporter permease [Pirellulaceae bacterium]|nr:ABC transporter permease [Pirellulaceae bacterium]